MPSELPDELKCLRREDVFVLRPFVLHQGSPKRMEAGYIVKDERSAISWKNKSVVDCIADLEDAAARSRCEKAYNWLLACDLSVYKNYIVAHKKFLRLEGPHGRRLPGHCITEPFLETALWPHLFPYYSWCPSSCSAPATWSRPFDRIFASDACEKRMLSSKAQFMKCVLSSILDYGREADLIQFQFDVFVFKKVALSRKMSGNADSSLELQHWSPEYWAHQHAVVLDIVDQLGYPDVFITISPYEWSFPWPYWIEKARQSLGLEPTELPGQETLALAHSLVQIVKGVIGGGTSHGGQGWDSHLLANVLDPKESNVQCVLARHEFQEGDRRHDGKGRGTIHVHALAWVKNLAATQLDSKLLAHAPDNDDELQRLMQRLQRASEPARIPARDEPSEWSYDVGLKRWCLSLYYPVAARLQRLRPVFRSLLRVLRCSQDVQWWHGKAALLQYVTGYTTKFKERWDLSWAISEDSPWTAGDLYSKYWQCAQPQMLMVLAREPMVYTTASTKRMKAPWNPGALPQSHTLYCLDQERELSLTYLQYLRTHREIGSIAQGTYRLKPYDKPHLVAIGVKYYAIRRDLFFWQWMLLNIPHRSERDLEPPESNQVSNHLKWYCAAIHVCPEKWANDVWLQEFFEKQGHRVEHINNMLAKLQADRYIIEGQLAGAIPIHIAAAQYQGPSNATLTAQQEAVLEDLHAELQLRDKDAWEDEEPPTFEQRPRFVTGLPGTGKSFVVAEFARQVSMHDKRVLIATPAARLGEVYRQTGLKASVETIHKAFSIPTADTSPDSWPINRMIGSWDVIIIDEISLLAKPIFEHIIRSWVDSGCWAVLIFCGDFAQLQPMGVRKGQSAPNALQSSGWSLVRTHTLTRQIRCECPELVNFLRTIRVHQPRPEQLDSFVNGIHAGPMSAEVIQEIFSRYPDITFLTTAKSTTSWINKLCLDIIAEGQESMSTCNVFADDGQEVHTMALYHGMKIMLTYNQSPERNLVNGQLATLLDVTPAGIMIELSNGTIEVLSPRWRWTNVAGREILQAGFHFVLGYAMTTYKAQGTTLKLVGLCLDVPKCPGVGYVAASRVKRRKDLIIIGEPSVDHFMPAPVM